MMDLVTAWCFAALALLSVGGVYAVARPSPFRRRHRRYLRSIRLRERRAWQDDAGHISARIFALLDELDRLAGLDDLEPGGRQPK